MRLDVNSMRGQGKKEKLRMTLIFLSYYKVQV